MYVGFNCKKRKGGKKMSVNYVHKEGAGVRRVMEIFISDFQFVFRMTSLRKTLVEMSSFVDEAMMVLNIRRK